MSYCQQCGAEVTGNFCSKCGAQSGTATQAIAQPVIIENANIKPRYGTGHIVLAGLLGCYMIFWAIFIGGASIFMFPELFKVDFSSQVERNVVGLFFVFPALAVTLGIIAFLCFRPGLKSIRKNTPKELLKQTRRSFYKKVFLFNPAWVISLAACYFIIGLICKAWRIGASVSKPNDTEYTAFVGDEKIAVTRLIDTQYSSDSAIRYIYIDAAGTYYRPPLY